MLVEALARGAASGTIVGHPCYGAQCPGDPPWPFGVVRSAITCAKEGRVPNTPRSPCDRRLTLCSGRWDSGRLPVVRTGVPSVRRKASKGAEIAELEIGAVIEGTVQRITPYGAFLTLEGGKVGLVHISEIDRNYVKDVREHLRENDVVQAKILAIKEDGKIDLSIKALQDPEPRVQRRRGNDPGFESMLKKFMKQSEERQVDFKRSVEHKRK